MLGSESSKQHRGKNTPLFAMLREQIEEAKHLVDSLKEVESKYGPVIEQEGLGNQIRALESWAESYRHGLMTALPWLDENLDKRLHSAMQEIARLENEGGHPGGERLQP